MARKVLEGAADLLTWIGGVALLLMMLHITADVTARFLFNSPLHGTVEIVPTYYMVAAVFLPLAMIERLNAHIVVELVSQHLPRRAQEIQIALVALVSAAYFGAFTWQTWGDAVQKYEVREMSLGNVAVTVWPTRFYVPIGCGLITVLLVYKAVRLFHGDNSVLNRGAHTELHE